MSWRRFIVLLAGLSAASRWQHALQGDGEQLPVVSADAWARQFKKAGD